MQDSRLTILREYATRIEAETVRIRLAAAEIEALITGDDVGTAMGMGGALTDRLVRIEVASDDFERADSILKEDERRRAEAGPWICSRCREQNEAAFEVCWSCSKPRTEEDETGRLKAEQPADDPSPPVSDSMTVPPEPPLVEDDNPYRAVLIENDEPPPPPKPKLKLEPTEEMIENAKRCFRAAIVSIFVFPPLVSFYTIYLLVDEPAAAYRDPSVRRKLLAAWIITAINLPAWLIFWFGQ